MTTVSDGTPLHDSTIRMMAAAIEPIENLDKILGPDWYVSGPIRVTHRDGWSPGYFDMNEDWVQFTPDYLEDGSA